VVGKKQGGTRRKSARGKTARRARAGKELEERVAQLEQSVDLFLRASLRGRVLPSERRLVKKLLDDSGKKEEKKASAKKVVRCPACRSVLDDPSVERCPWCSFWLTEARKATKKTTRRKRGKKSAKKTSRRKKRNK